MNTSAQPHANSYYAASAHKIPHYPSLKGQQSVDICIIGAGMTGLSAALELSLKGYRVAVLESQRISWGASGRSGGQMIVNYGSSPQQMQKIMGEDDAKSALHISIAAQQLIRQRIKQYEIDCDLAQGQAEVAARAIDMSEFSAMQHILETQHNYPIELLDRAQLADQLYSDNYHGAYYDPQGGHIHPLNYSLGLASAAANAGALFFENTEVCSIDRQATTQVNTPTSQQNLVKTAQGSILCDRVIVAANAYLGRLLPRIAKTILPVGSYICATQPLDHFPALMKQNIAIADTKFLTNYFRLSADNRLLFGGRTGLTQQQPKNLLRVMQRRIEHVFPQLEGVGIDYQWGGNVAVTRNRMPDMGRLQNNIYYAHGFSGHGVLMANMAGKLMADAVAGDAEQFDVFSRIKHRSYPGGTALRAPGLAMAMIYFAMRDLIG